MTARRRRVLREDVLAPWLTLVVVIALWWAGASLIGRTPAGTATPADSDLRLAPESPSPGLVASPRSKVPAPPEDRDSLGAEPAVTPALGPIASPDAIPPPVVDTTDVVDLIQRKLVVPVAGVESARLVSSYHEGRSGGRRHEALDIFSPRGTAVVAVDDGRIAKLFTSARGGLTIYQFDPTERYCYYYAHLDGYAPDLNEGAQLTRGTTIGYVGTTGNAPANTPHLHFAIFKLGQDKRWWQGTPLDPYLVLR